MKTTMLIIVLLSVMAISTYIRGDTLCDTGIEYRVEYLIQPSMNKMVIFSVSGNNILVVAMDFNRDGNYTMLVFDINGNGYADFTFTNGTATEELVFEMYCEYQRLVIS